MIVTYKDEFERIRIKMSKCGTEYPPMKLMDMCMWQSSYEKEMEEKKNRMV